MTVVSKFTGIGFFEVERFSFKKLKRLLNLAIWYGNMEAGSDPSDDTRTALRKIHQEKACARH